MMRQMSMIGVLLLALAACSATAPVPEDRFYQLDNAPGAAALQAPALRGGLRVAPVTADPLRSGRAVLYRDARKPLELQRYHYQYWVDQPPRMIEQALLNYLRTIAAADPVQDNSRRAAVAYRLQTRLLRFEQVLDEGAPRVELELEATLYPEPSGAALWTATYLRRVDSTGNDMHATAQAMQLALAQVFQALRADLVATGKGQE